MTTGRLAFDDFSSGDKTGGTGWDDAAWVGTAKVVNEAVEFGEKNKFSREVTIPSGFTGDLSFSLENFGQIRNWTFSAKVVGGSTIASIPDEELAPGQTTTVTGSLAAYAGQTITLELSRENFTNFEK